jgi:anti-anti-sigma regulatory factor
MIGRMQTKLYTDLQGDIRSTDRGLLNLLKHNLLLMPFKFETKEKFHAITVDEPELTASLSAELTDFANKILTPEVGTGDVRNLILIMHPVQRIELPAAESLAELQAFFYESGASFVICCLQPAVEKTLELADLLDLMNITPTESEAWDIVQMEEIERELLSGEEEQD